MKQKLLAKMLLLCALMVGVGNAWAQEQQEQPQTKTKYVLTAPKDILETDIVVIVDTAAKVAIANNASEGKAPSATAIYLNDNKDQLLEENSNSSSGSTGTSTKTDFSKLEWKVAKDVTGNNYLCNFYTTTTTEGDNPTTTTNYLFVTNADDGLRIGTPADGDVKAFGLAKDEGNNQADFLSVTFVGEGDSKSYRYVGVKSMFSIINSWKTKESIDDDIKNTKIAFFVKKESALADVTLTFPKANYEADYHGGTGTFTAPTLTKKIGDYAVEVAVTYSSSDEATAEVNATTGVITLKKRGTAKITASAAEQEITDPEDAGKKITIEAAETSYTLRIDDSTKKGSQNDPYTPSGAIAALKNMSIGTNANYFVEGYVAKIEEKDATSILNRSGNAGTLTYWISNDGYYDDVTKNTLKISTGNYSENGELADLNDRILSVGDKVKVVGPLVYASSTPASTSFGGGTGSTRGTGENTDEKEFRMDATNYIHVHTPVLVKKDMQMIVNQTIESADFATEKGLYTINDIALSGSLKGSGVTIESSNQSVAKVANSGKFESREVGTTVITVTVPATVAHGENNSYKDYNIVGKFTVTVIDRNVYPATADKYELVTNASTLADGDKLIIVGTAKDFMDDSMSKVVAMSSTQNDTDRGAVEVTVDGTTIKNIPEGAQVVTYKYKDNSDKYYLNVGIDADEVEQYLYASSSEDDELKTGALFEVSKNAAVTITIDSDNNATIKFGDGSDGTSSHNVLKYDGMLISGYDLGSNFACFEDNSGSGSGSSTTSSSGTLPKIYKYVKTDSYDVTINASGYKTFVAGEDFKLPEGLQAFVVTSVTDDEAELTDVTEKNIKANTAYILKGTAEETYTLTTTTTEATDPENNLLKVSNSSTDTGVYVLATHDGVTGFYKWTGGLIGSGRVYLPSPSAARIISLIEGETTGITQVNSKVVTDNHYFNLNGQRVAQPKKGLYIVNGKKAIIK